MSLCFAAPPAVGFEAFLFFFFEGGGGILGFGFRVWGLGFRVLGLGFRALGFGLCFDFILPPKVLQLFYNLDLEPQTWMLV